MKINLQFFTLIFLLNVSFNANAVCNLNASYSYTDSMGHLTFTNNSTGTFNKVTWHYNSTLMNSNKIYLPVAGDYYIILTVYDTNQIGCKDTFMSKVHSNGDCITQAGFKYISENVGKNSAQYSNTSKGNRMKCLWQFGDGNQSNQFNPLHQFSSEGSYQTQLILIDSLYTWCRDSIVLPVSVQACFAKADFDFIDTMGLLFYFTNQSKFANALIWEMGDGVYKRDQWSLYHSYSKYQPTYVTLIARDTIHNFCADTIVKPIMGLKCQLNNRAEINYFTNVTNKVDFNALSEMVTDYSWDFGDGNRSNSKSISHVYANEGDYNVKLIIKDSLVSGCADSSQFTVRVRQCQTPHDFDIKDSLGIVTFKTVAQMQSVKWSWTNGGSGGSIIHPYMVLYFNNCDTVRMSSYAIGISDGCISKVEKTFVPQLLNPRFIIKPDTTQSYAALVIDKSTSRLTPSYLWGFGDGSKSFAKKTIHTYPLLGKYNLCLTLSASNCEATYCDTIGFNYKGQLLLTRPFTIRIIEEGDHYASVNDADKLAFKIYPNPSNAWINIETTEPIRNIKIFDSNGKQLLETKETSIDLSLFNNGVMIVEVEMENGLKFYKRMEKL